MAEAAGKVGGIINSATKLIGVDLKPPKPPEAPSQVTEDSKAVQQSVAEAAQRRSKARGYRSTILSQNFMAPDAAALKETMGS